MAMTSVEKELLRLEKAIHGNAEELLDEIRGLRRAFADMAKTQEIIRRVMVYGEAGDKPWFSLDYGKMRQVQKVYDYFKEHPTADIPTACRAVYAPNAGGYKKLTGLVSYCYRIRVDRCE